MFQAEQLANNYDPTPLMRLMASMGTGGDNTAGAASAYSTMLGQPPESGGGLGGDTSTATSGGTGRLGPKGATPFNPQMLAMMQAMMPKPQQPAFAPAGHVNPNPQIHLAANPVSTPTLAQLLGRA